MIWQIPIGPNKIVEKITTYSPGSWPWQCDAIEMGKTAENRQRKDPASRKSITNRAEIPWKSWKLNLLIQPNPFPAKSRLIEWAKSIVASKNKKQAAKCFSVFFFGWLVFGIQRQPLMVKQFQFPVKNLYKRNILLLSKNRSGQTLIQQPHGQCQKECKVRGAEAVAGHEPESDSSSQLPAPISNSKSNPNPYR